MSWQRKIAKALKEVRFILAPERNSGANLFVQKNLPLLRDTQPDFPFIVRECEGIDDFVVFRYNFGIERKYELNDKTEQEVE